MPDTISKKPTASSGLLHFVGFPRKRCKWSRRESNPRPLECDSSALPTELRPHAVACNDEVPSTQVVRRSQGSTQVSRSAKLVTLRVGRCDWSVRRNPRWRRALAIAHLANHDHDTVPLLPPDLSTSRFRAVGDQINALARRSVADEIPVAQSHHSRWRKCALLPHAPCHSRYSSMTGLFLSAVSCVRNALKSKPSKSGKIFIQTVLPPSCSSAALPRTSGRARAELRREGTPVPRALFSLEPGCPQTAAGAKLSARRIDCLGPSP
jgi:hypothetical protein